MQKEDILGHIELNPSAYDKLEIVQICLNENAYEHEDELIRLLNTVFSTRKSFNEIETLPNLMAKPVDKARRIRYNFYGILCIWSYLIIPWIADSSESVFCF
ncbi:hypothetical protein FAEUMB_30040 [Faecalimonas umbilicata]|uniref:Uncharacterized protein n=1 Tax=Faecalimonas umbilicata TaxID=1912855 RepID=A0ABQ0R0D4_9FIRM|nr:hypothetical protein FAEUMB_26870 [Faecalimonas umbilicata]GBU06463.1 hypothetical protein FAEUMB_30040 [Faecalimonas umbilicata]